MQSRWHSFLESAVNILVGYSIGVASQMLVFPLFGIKVTLAENLLMGLYFTVISLARSYVIRRMFNQWHMKLVSK